MDIFDNPAFVGIIVPAVAVIIAGLIAALVNTRSAKVTASMTLLGVLQTDNLNIRLALKGCEDRSDKLELRARELGELIELLHTERDAARVAYQAQRTSDEKDLLLTKSRIELLEKAAVAAEAALVITSTAAAAALLASNAAAAAQAVLDTAQKAASAQAPPAAGNPTVTTVNTAPHVEGEPDAVYAPVLVLPPTPDEPKPT